MSSCDGEDEVTVCEQTDATLSRLPFSHNLMLFNIKLPSASS
jgi:hypothetical protein